jgi:sulfate transport system ATP-binding protein
MALARALAVDPKVLLLDEPFGALDAKVRADLRAWLRRLHDEVHVTTVLVTHDQEEALDVADRIALLHQGRIEQVGSPDDLYDRPANEFVMSFLGSVSRLGGRLVRPHDIVLERSTDADGVLATVLRVVRLGFEVRVELRDDAGAEFTAQLTRGDVDALVLHEGDLVVARTIRAGPFAESTRPDEPLVHRHDVDDEAPVAVAR